MTNTRLLVNRRKFDQSRIEQVPLPALSDGEVLVKTGEFGFTANNVSYALSGDMIGYWKYFPVEGDEWGIVPVWGFAEVIESRCVSLPVGSKFWGFLPMASHVVMKPVTITSGNFVDGADHRLPLPEMYNRYQRTEGDPPELIAAADARSVLFPLCFTGYVLADYLQDNDFFGATQVIIGSASSKTALGTAHFISQLANRPVKLVGLTSANNLAFLRDVDLFDEVVGYDDVPMAAWPAYGLTTIRQPVNRMVEATVAALLDQIEGGSPAPTKVKITGPLMVRTSARIPEGWKE